MSIRFWVALWVSKLYRFGIRLMGKDGSHTPGTLALKICPDFLKRVGKPEKIFCVTGTNGKTTTSNLVASILKKEGFSVTNNSLGSNILGGVTCALLADVTLFNKATKQVAVLEVDERSSLLVYAQLTPDMLICNNIMRDSLKRNAHMDFISHVLNSALPPSTKVILNGDDYLCARLFPNNQNRVYFGISANKPTDSEKVSRDVLYCPKCNGKLKAEYVRFDHIGRIYCPECDKKPILPDYDLVDMGNDFFTVAYAGKTFGIKSLNANLINYYNAMGAITLLHEFGLSEETLHEAFEHLEIVKTRYDYQKAGQVNITMQMAKGENPGAVGRAYAYAAACPGEKKFVLVMTDDPEENHKSVENTAWIYDTDCSPLADSHIAHVVFCGRRRFDNIVRAQIAGVPRSKMEDELSYYDAARKIDLNTYKDIVVLYDSFLTAEAAKVENILVKRGENL